MQAILRLKPRRLSNSNFNPLFRLSSSYLHSSSSCSTPHSVLSPTSAHSSATNSFTAPWSTIQRRGIKVSASDIRVGNIIGKQGRIFEVLKVDHSHEGRGKATIKVELRDIGQGTKVTQRVGTGEDIERVYVQEKTFMYMCMDQDGTVVLMDPDTLDQIEVSKDLFGKNSSYIQDEMKVKVQFYDDKPLSASVPKRVTCTVKEVIAATPRNKKVVLDNGPTVEDRTSGKMIGSAKMMDGLYYFEDAFENKVAHGLSDQTDDHNPQEHVDTTAEIDEGNLVPDLGGTWIGEANQKPRKMVQQKVCKNFQVPTHIVAGDAIVVNTEDDSYLERAKA